MLCIFHNAEQCMALLIEQQHAKHTNMFISVVLVGNSKEMVVQLVSTLLINVVRCDVHNLICIKRY